MILVSEVPLSQNRDKMKKKKTEQGTLFKHPMVALLNGDIYSDIFHCGYFNEIIFNIAGI